MNLPTIKDISFYCNVSSSSTRPIIEKKIDYYDLTIITKGKMDYYIDGTYICLNENDAILIPPGSVRTRTSGNKQVKYTSFNFTISENYNIIDRIYMPSVVTDEIRRILSISNITRLSPSHLHKEKEKLACLLSYILLELQNILEFESSNKHIMEIIKYINSNITESISLSEVSKAVNLSKEYTASIFKKETGLTVNKYINERKLVMAKEMIAVGNMSLQEISENIGYENYGYFSRIFKKRFGMPPKEFKNSP